MRIVLILVSIAAMLALALVMGSGTPLRLQAALVLVLLPLLGYLAYSKPLIFPYGLYVLLIPFDNLLAVGRGGTLTRMLGIAAGIALLAWCLRKQRMQRAGIPLAAAGALLAWSAASALWSVDQQAVLQTLPTYAGLIGLYAAVCVMPVTPRQFRWLLVAVAAAGVISAMYGINAFVHDPMLARQDPIARRLLVKVGQSSIDPNEYADALLFPAAILLMFGLRATNVVRKLGNVALVAIVAAAILLSGSREAAIGLGILLIYFAWRSPYRIELAFIVGTLVFALGNLHSSLWLRFANGASPRQSIWSVGFEAFKHRWFAGYGLGTFSDAYDTYYLKVHQLYSNGWSSPAHNVIVGFSVELGIVGTVLIAWFFWAQFARLRRIPRSHPLYDYRTLMEGALLSLGGALMFIDLFNYKWAWLIFAAAAQLCGVYENASTSERIPAAREHPESSRNARPRLPAATHPARSPAS